MYDYINMCLSMRLCTYVLDFSATLRHVSWASMQRQDQAVLQLTLLSAEIEREGDWVAVKELDLSYHNPKTILFTVYP